MKGIGIGRKIEGDGLTAFVAADDVAQDQGKGVGGRARPRPNAGSSAHRRLTPKRYPVVSEQDRPSPQTDGSDCTPPKTRTQEIDPYATNRYYNRKKVCKQVRFALRNRLFANLRVSFVAWLGPLPHSAAAA